MARWWLVLLTLVAMMALMAVACEDEEEEAAETPAAEGALKIGVLFAFTGDLGEFGEPIETGAKLAAKHINDAGGVLGGDVELKRGDTQTAPAAGVEAARQLVDVDGVQAILGALSTGVTLAVAEGVAIPEGVIQITPASTAVALAALDDNDFVFRTTLSDALQGKILAELAQELGFEKLGIMYTNNPYGEGLADALKENFESLGGEVTASVPHEQEQTSYLSELQKATDGEPDALAALSYPQSATVYLKEALENDLIDTFLFCDGTKSEDIIEGVGAEPLEGTYGTVSKAEEADAWLTEYEEEFGELPPLPYIAESYDAVVMIALGAEKAQSTDPAAIRDAMRTLNDPEGEEVTGDAEGVARALELIREGKAINYVGASGFQGWDEKGDLPSGSIEIWKIEDGEIVSVRVEPVSSE